MTDFLTPQQLARRTSDAVGAAVGAGRDLGLTVTDARVLHDLFSVVVHLAPAPVVVRVPTVLASTATLDSQERLQRAELDVTHWLADRGTPVIPPSPLVPREPVRRDGFSMTFWHYVEEVQGKEPDYVANSESVAGLHAAMRDYPGPLPFLSSAAPEAVAADLALLATDPGPLSAADLERARREWEVLEPLVRSREAFEKAFPGIDLQPIHGDSPAANIFPGVHGNLYADFELVTLGPVEWDMAALGPDLESAYDRGARRNGMRPLRADVMGFVTAVGMLRAATTLITLAPRLPALAEYVEPTVEQWRATPFAGGPAGPVSGSR
ncbi:aminoglycoside phosphotransferase family protein [Nonomuraea sp. MG754425]|uniref:aminoglycoside phosphotransferase family protein n=1 Tax=Nonomuraea sp. MG754425 TaxID=2570319 RepID=UPI001F20479E|nr:aminoglycoside phosphotransferase family protein [Nonomuraea sp. MG754425]MCF6470539.1 aminoglycoside phosphotransferase family protein [Nonomuraea sp. MG754425]